MSPLISKVLMGVSAGAVLALIVVFNMLMSSKEANGALVQGIEDARATNERQTLTISEMEKNNANLLVQMEAERENAKMATEAKELSEMHLVDAEADFDERLRAAVEGMSDEDLECASEFVPPDLINSLSDSSPSIPTTNLMDTLSTNTMLVSNDRDRTSIFEYRDYAFLEEL